MADTLGQRIAHLRTSNNLTQSELMELLNFHNLSRYEKDLREPPLSVILSLAKHFNVSTDWLLTGCNPIHQELSSAEERILGLYRQLDRDERLKIEGMLELKVSEVASQKLKSSNSQDSDESIMLA